MDIVLLPKVCLGLCVCFYYGITELECWFYLIYFLIDTPPENEWVFEKMGLFLLCVSLKQRCNYLCC
uniref:Uncharacterized protein n=1 Tax=Anguilla anguilla TaxID=7936 RepID=A0A0E9WZM9_ANGAN